MQSTTPHPLEKKLNRYLEARKQFQQFAKGLTDADVADITQKNPRFEPLARWFSFYRFSRIDDAVQWHFTSRITGRNLIVKDKLAAATENGGSLVYSLGPTGHVIVLLYATSSPLYKPREEGICLHFGLFSAQQLRGFVEQDFRDLIAYTYVTNLDGGATWREYARIWWLRLVRRTIKEGSVVKSAVEGAAVSISNAGIKFGMGVLPKIALFLFFPTLVAVLVLIGFPELAARMSAILSR